MTITPVWIGSPHYYDQTNVPKLFITMHWMVGNLLGTDRAFNGTRAASSTYGVEGDVIHQYVEERDYPFSDGNTYANRHTISIEHAGGWLLPDGTRYKPTQATHETSARLCADIALRHGFGKLVVGVNMFPHKHWVSTTCPGTLDIAWIAARANAINDGTAGGDVTPIKEEEIMATNWVDTSTYKDGKAVAGTQCLTTWEGGGKLEYPRTMLPGETAAVMNGAYGPHREVDHALFETLKVIFAPSSSGGGGSDGSEVLKAVAGVSVQVTGLPSKTDLEATRDQIVAKIPTKLTP